MAHNNIHGLDARLQMQLSPALYPPSSVPLTQAPLGVHMSPRDMSPRDGIDVARENMILKQQLMMATNENQRLKSLYIMEAQDKKQKVEPVIPSQTRYWTDEEHQRFLEAAKLFGHKNVKAISQHVGTRNPTQVRTHAQKYLLKMRRDAEANGEKKEGEGENGSQALSKTGTERDSAATSAQADAKPRKSHHRSDRKRSHPEPPSRQAGQQAQQQQQQPQAAAFPVAPQQVPQLTQQMMMNMVPQFGGPVVPMQMPGAESYLGTSAAIGAEESTPRSMQFSGPLDPTGFTPRPIPDDFTPRPFVDPMLTGFTPRPFSDIDGFTPRPFADLSGFTPRPLAETGFTPRPIPEFVPASAAAAPEGTSKEIAENVTGFTPRAAPETDMHNPAANNASVATTEVQAREPGPTISLQLNSSTTAPNASAAPNNNAAAAATTTTTTNNNNSSSSNVPAPDDTTRSIAELLN